MNCVGQVAVGDDFTGWLWNTIHPAIRFELRRLALPRSCAPACVLPSTDSPYVTSALLVARECCLNEKREADSQMFTAPDQLQ